MSVRPSLLQFPQSKLPGPYTAKTNNCTCKTETLFSISFTQFPSAKLRFYSSFRVANPKNFSQFCVSKNEEQANIDNGFQEVFRKFVSLVQSILLGGGWWNLSEHQEDDIKAAKPMTALLALRRMWELVADERRVAFFAFVSLAIAALSEISMPSIMAASIFAAQRGETMAFSGNAQLLLVLCCTSGICSGLRSGCFGILNVILFASLTSFMPLLHCYNLLEGHRQLKRLRENLYAALLFQDISYFDREKVGNLTSRVAADCQRLSHVIGNDLQLILRNTFQGTGAVVNLLILSWPLALSALVICSILSAIFLVYGQYQRKAAKLTQDFTACANEVALETLLLIRTVRTYGTEKKEFGRYKQWLQGLGFINTRESVAYGLWTVSFNTLYRSTQIFAVLLGGMSILSCRVTVEQLTNPLEHLKKFFN